jgi:hypothetical protein
VSFAVVDALAILVGGAYPNCQNLHGSLLFLVPDLLNTI